LVAFLAAAVVVPMIYSLNTVTATTTIAPTTTTTITSTTTSKISDEQTMRRE